MKIYDLNETPDMYEIGEDQYVWLVTDYHNYDYEGDGEAVGLRLGGSLDMYNLGHCSC